MPLRHSIPEDILDRIETSLDDIIATADLLQLLSSENALGRINLTTLPSLGRLIEAEANRISRLVQNRNPQPESDEEEI